MKSPIRSFKRAFGIATVVSASALLVTPGCAVDAGEEGATPERVASTSQAIHQSKVISVNQVKLQAMLNARDVWSTTLTVHNGHGVLTAPPALAAVIKKSTIEFDVPTVSAKPHWYTPRGYARIRSLNLDPGSLSIFMEDDAVGVDASASGMIHFHARQGDADLRVNRLTVHLDVGIAGDSLVLKNDPVVSLVSRVENCSLGAWCDALLAYLLPDLSGEVKKELKKQVDKTLADPDTWKSFIQQLEIAAGYGDSGPPWFFVPGTASIAGSQLTYSVQRVIPPSAPANCRLSTRCDSGIDVACDANPDGLVATIQDSAGAWWSWGKVASVGPGLSVMSLPGDFNVDTANVIVCSKNEAGTACIDPLSIAVDHTACGGGLGLGTGGGGRDGLPSSCRRTPSGVRCWGHPQM